MRMFLRCLACYLRIFYYVSANVCPTLEYLVNGPSGVDNSSMTSSSFFTRSGVSTCPAFLGRLHMQPYFDERGIEYNSWCAKGTTIGEYIQVRFASLKTMVAILTQGRAQSPNYPLFSFYSKSFKVRYSLDGLVWTDLMENSTAKVFTGNTDRDTVNMNYFPSPVDANYICVVVQDFHISICLRIDVLGCDTINKSMSYDTSVGPISTGNNWGYAGTATGEFPLDDVIMNSTTQTRIMCVSRCSQTADCLITAYDSLTRYCIGYGRTDLIGPFKPSDSEVMPADDYVTLFFNYDYANVLGFTSILASGLSVKVSYVRMVQQDAEETCRFWNAVLVTVTFPKQLSALHAIISENSSLASEPGLYVGGCEKGGQYVYQRRGTEVPDNFWDFGQPDFQFKCIILTMSGKLATRNCSDSLFFICSLL